METDAQILHGLLARAPWNIRTLAAEANRIVSDWGLVPISDAAQRGVTRRLIRYYVARGVVPRPSGGASVNATYGYRHLLAVLAIKALQSRGRPLAAIKSELDASSDADLERLVANSRRHHSDSSGDTIATSPLTARP